MRLVPKQTRRGSYVAAVLMRNYCLELLAIVPSVELARKAGPDCTLVHVCDSAASYDIIYMIAEVSAA